MGYAIAYIYVSEYTKGRKASFHHDSNENYDVYNTLGEAAVACSMLEYDHCFVVLADTAEYIVTGRNGDGSSYDWDDSECTCGECYDCVSEMERQDMEYVELAGVEYEIMTAGEMTEGQEAAFADRYYELWAEAGFGERDDDGPHCSPDPWGWPKEGHPDLVLGTRDEGPEVWAERYFEQCRAELTEIVAEEKTMSREREEDTDAN